MCGRYQFSTKESREMQQIIRDAERRSRGRFPVEANFPPAGDVAPTQVAPSTSAGASPAGGAG